MYGGLAKLALGALLYAQGMGVAAYSTHEVYHRILTASLHHVVQLAVHKHIVIARPGLGEPHGQSAACQTGFKVSAHPVEGHRSIVVHLCTARVTHGGIVAPHFLVRTFCIHSLRTAQQGAQDEDRKFFHIVFYH